MRNSAVASTSAATPTTQNSLKRKSRDESEDEDGGEEQQDDEKDDPSFGDEKENVVVVAAAAAPPVKKRAKKEKKPPVKKPLVKKVAVWKDIQEWKEGDNPLGLFPLEVLDLIISVDSDLDLRDHLALAATCRFFRTCYRDVVFQVLYHSKNPSHRLPGHLTTIGSDGSCYNSYSSKFIGPIERSFNEARHIFTSSALPRDGWGLPDDEWEKDGKIKQDKERTALVRLLEAEREATRDECRIVVEREDAKRLAQWEVDKVAFEASDKARVQAAQAAGQPAVERIYPSAPMEQGEWGVERMLESFLQRDITVHGKWVKPDNHVPPPYTNPRVSQTKSNKYTPSDTPPAARDPWESAHRYMVADVVNLPRISKTEAKSTFKLSDRELMALPQVFQYPHYRNGTPKHYLRSAVEALSLRSHGGAAGHGAYLDKLQVRKEKAHATRVKNGTLVVPKVKAPRYGYGWGYSYNF